MTYTEPRIDLLYFNGCPSYKQAWNDIFDVLVEERCEAPVHLIAVEDPALWRAVGKKRTEERGGRVRS